MTAYLDKVRGLFPLAEWMERAACYGMDAGIFFDLTAESNAKAIDVCGACPVRADCLVYALERGLNTDFDGVWGGATPMDRRRMVRRSRRSA